MFMQTAMAEGVGFPIALSRLLPGLIEERAGGGLVGRIRRGGTARAMFLDQPEDSGFDSASLQGIAVVHFPEPPCAARKVGGVRAPTVPRAILAPIPFPPTFLKIHGRAKGPEKDIL